MIDFDPHNALAAELANLGAIVVCGNAMDPLVLMRAHAVCAKGIFLCTRDDKANIAISKAAERLTRRLSDGEVAKLESAAAQYSELQRARVTVICRPGRENAV